MSKFSGSPVSKETRRSRRRAEILTFLVLAFGIWPVVAVGVVGGYGFLVWMLQLIFGPPGPPSH
ncbi:periplasmic nitrate reductase, NapE protein [Phyllobacterium sophorae]|uniref:Periplasmic nitrate reductase, NapE protein n=1 Tax=Phyllobacterium sophorae TaxID=1520277 RepID=A0A2P7AXH1_9HYPH|nr:periplasmic nitrate reductase, NapE protein [Phyllobacterium sophorae]PSH58916.1 periplasmic nitrate reductase, NapE protein [Phyllobacterium sophorae]